eukprot:CAMPEP_0182830580 /NCGR_PEP_ID=MMETSP0006_2-20121128/18653_1 /TAXON_ID=97485 /ORGANISM="Prymnesium parvum, Strain Texoma1" /LENGTH=1019 /DNA_ID=CAMNT_0024958161 /DNA_START=95 /DNA_END=3155 /DNA_ORIENTATION=+
MSECPVLVCARGTELTFTLPSKWMSRPLQQLVILPFIQTYNSHKERSGRLSSDDLLAVTSPLSLATLSRIEIDGTEVPLKAVHAPTSSIVEAHQRVDLTFGPSPEERRSGERRPSDGVPSASNLSLSIQSRINRLSDQDLPALSRRSPERRPRAVAPEVETTRTPQSTEPQKDVLPPETPASQQTMPETPASQLTLIAATSPEAATATPLKPSRKLFGRPETPASQNTLTGAGSSEPEQTPASNSSRTASRRPARASFEPNPISGQLYERPDSSPPAPAETPQSQATPQSVLKKSTSASAAANRCEGCRANNYQVSSNMPKNEPTKRVDTVDIEELVSQSLSGEEIKFCRCYRSSRFPLCDGAHNAHNKEAGDNAGPVVIKSFPPSDKRPTLPPVAAVSEAELSRGIVGKRANNYGIESNMPPNDPQRRVDILDVVAVSDCVTQKGMVKLCRCYKSATFPYCDGSHVEHNQKTGDNCGPLIIDASAVPARQSSARTAPAPAAPVAQGKERVVPLAEVALHSKPGDMWMVIHGVVYDLSDFAKVHPGGESILMQYAGKIADEGFDENHAESVITQNLPPEKRIGVLAPMEANSVPPIAPAAAESSPALSSEATALAKKATLGPKPPIESCINLYDFELVARTYLKPSSYAYYATGSTDEFTKTGNQAIYRRIKLVPRVMIDVSDVDLEVEVLGTRMSFPVYISGAAKGGVSGNPDAEVALCRAAYAAGVVQMAPHMPTKPHAEIAAARADGQTQWLQLYMETDRAASEKFVREAEGSMREAERLGFAALFVTVDSAGIGKRERDLRLTPGGSAPRSVATKRRWASDMTWEDLHWLRTLFTGKIVLKGVQCAADAVRAYREGADGIVISNHGGRNMDTARPSLEVLIEVMPALRREWGTAGDASMRCIAQCLPAPKPRPFEVLIDGGIMRGSDVYKAIALGAKAVGIGRAALWGLSAYGQQGTEQVLKILRNELFTTMQMMGKTHLHQLAADSLAGVDEAIRGAAWADSASRDHLPPLALD